MRTHESTFMFHFKEKQENIKSRAPFRNVFKTLPVKSACSETAARTHKMETFPIPRVLMVRMSRKESIFDSMSTKEAIVDAIPVKDEDNLEGEMREQLGSETTVMEIANLRNECVRETEDDFNRRLIKNHKEVKKGCYKKKKSPVWDFSLLFWKFACDDGAVWYYCTLCHCAEPSTQQETMKGVVKYTKKSPDYGTMSFMDMRTSSLVSWSSLSCRRPHSQTTYLS